MIEDGTDRNWKLGSPRNCVTASFSLIGANPADEQQLWVLKDAHMLPPRLRNAALTSGLVRFKPSGRSAAER